MLVLSPCDNEIDLARTAFVDVKYCFGCCSLMTSSFYPSHELHLKKLVTHGVVNSIILILFIGKVGGGGHWMFNQSWGQL